MFYVHLRDYWREPPASLKLCGDCSWRTAQNRLSESHQSAPVGRQGCNLQVLQYCGREVVLNYPHCCAVSKRTALWDCCTFVSVKKQAPMHLPTLPCLEGGAVYIVRAGIKRRQGSHTIPAARRDMSKREHPDPNAGAAERIRANAGRQLH